MTLFSIIVSTDRVIRVIATMLVLYVLCMSIRACIMLIPSCMKAAIWICSFSLLSGIVIYFILSS